MRTVSIALNKRGGQSWHISRILSADTARVLACPGFDHDQQASRRLPGLGRK